ncbi:MAG: MmgE/PrpD family protein [Pseudomonadota bacterium]|nr:MmgE/PrpD family protein [Pseudomonadota bacterium]MDQ2805014.1 MmgE/PrpD family protein [Pseudomonadota bacterium]
MPLTQSIGRFVADLSPNHLPEQAVATAKLGFIDCIGTMIAGRDEDAVRILKSVLAPPSGPCSITFGEQRGPAPDAAWINGTAAHALDYDDVGCAGILRPCWYRRSSRKPRRSVPPERT